MIRSDSLLGKTKISSHQFDSFIYTDQKTLLLMRYFFNSCWSIRSIIIGRIPLLLSKTNEQVIDSKQNKLLLSNNYHRLNCWQTITASFFSHIIRSWSMNYSLKGRKRIFCWIQKNAKHTSKIQFTDMKNENTRAHRWINWFLFCSSQSLLIDYYYRMGKTIVLMKNLFHCLYY